MSRSLGVCRLCCEARELRRSHIVPRSIINRCKGGQGQLVTFSSDASVSPELSNYDPKERLLCSQCEKFLDTTYERHGASLLFPARKDRGKRLVRMPGYVKFKNFKYEDTYLFFLSIFWRASISSLSTFASITFGQALDKEIAASLREKTLSLRGSSVRLDGFMRLVMVKLTDPTGQLTDEWFRNTMIGVNTEAGECSDLLVYFGVGGFLVGFYISPPGESYVGFPSKWTSPVAGAKVFRAACVPVQELKQVQELLNATRTANPPMA